MRRVLFIAAALAATATAASAADQVKRYGAWEVSIERNRFDDRTKVIAAVTEGLEVLAARCLDDGKSVAIGELGLGNGPFSSNQPFKIKIRVDKNKVEDLFGIAVNSRFIQVAESHSIVDQLKGAKEVAIRIENTSGVHYDLVFKTPGSDKAISEIRSACPD